MRIRMFRNAAIVILGAWPAMAMAGPRCTAVFLAINGATNTYAKGIAADGQIVGWSTLGVSEGWIWSSPNSSPVGIVPPGVAGAQILITDGTTQGGSLLPEPVDLYCRSVFAQRRGLGEWMFSADPAWYLLRGARECSH